MQVATEDLITIGEAMALFRTGQNFSIGSEFALSFGGAEANVAIGCTRLGLRTLWLSALGDDPFGRLIREALQREGVSTNIKDSTAATGHMIKFPSAGEDPTVIYFRKDSPASQLNQDSFSLRALPQAKVLHLSGVFLALGEGCEALAMRLSEEAKALGMLVSFDINYRARLWPAEKAKDTMLPIAEQADIIFGGEAELALIAGAGEYSDSIAEELVGNSSRQVVVKRGSRGASVFAGASWTHVAAHSISVIDTVGAGDAFVAGYLSELIRGHDVSRMLQVANYCGARACENPGDWEGMVSTEILEHAKLLETSRTKPGGNRD